MTPYKVYGLYLHPSGGEATLPADGDQRRYYENKGFTFLAHTESPGVQPVHIYEPVDESGRVLAGLALTPGGTAAIRAEGGSAQKRGENSAQDEEQEAEKEIRQKLQERGVPDEDGNHDRIVHMAMSRRVSVPERTSYDPTVETLPGELVATGVTRGVAGMDNTMPSLVPGVSATNQTQQRDAVSRGEVEYVDQEVDAGGKKVTLKLPRAVPPGQEGEARQRARGVPKASPSPQQPGAVLPSGSTEVTEVAQHTGGPPLMGRPADNQPRSVAGPADAPGDTPSASTPQAPDPTVTDQARHQEVRQKAMQAEGKAEGKQPPSFPEQDGSPQVA